MPVYVDNFGAKYGRMIMCHMLADTVDELHSMADLIGIKRKWFQGKGKTPHYDICKAKRALAIENGAISVTWRELAQIIKKVKNKP